MIGFVIGVLAFFLFSALVVGASLWVVFREEISAWMHQYIVERAQGSRIQPLNDGDAHGLVSTMFIEVAAQELLAQNPSVYDMRSWAPKLPELQMHDLFIDAADMEAVNVFVPTFSALAGYEQVQSTYENLMRRIAIPPRYAGVVR